MKISSSRKNSITRNRHRSISNADVEIVKKTVQIFERHEEVVAVSSDNTDILVLTPSCIKSTASTAHAICQCLEQLGY